MSFFKKSSLPILFPLPLSRCAAAGLVVEEINVAPFVERLGEHTDAGDYYSGRFDEGKLFRITRAAT